MNYLIVLPGIYLDRKVLTDIFDNDYRITDWGYSLPNAIFVKANCTAKDLSSIFEKHFGEKKHAIVEIAKGNYWGRLPTDQWRFFK